jgi:hypothetical protein
MGDTMALGRSSTAKAKIAAAALTAATLIGGAGSANAQQTAAAQPDFSACDQMSATAPAKAIQCRVDVLKAHGAAADVRGAAADVRGAAADKRIAAVDDSIACAKFLLSKKAAGVTLDRTRLNREKGCVYARELGMQ